MNIHFDPQTGLVPAVIQHYATGQVLMLGYMNQTSMDQTIKTGRVTFYSRSRKALWVKGATSGNFFKVISINPDCDADTLLIQVQPAGPACHTGQYSCFGTVPEKGFLHQLEHIIRNKISTQEPGSYTAALYQKGINKIAQKVGEEATELIIEAKDNNRDLFCNEAADLLYHLLLLLQYKETKLEDIEAILYQRHVSVRL
jgi:phosphoribosyl-AMP cyclohydrolase / phosphoribosyl-ATP pyrophosphohydrolase